MRGAIYSPLIDLFLILTSANHCENVLCISAFACSFSFFCLWFRCCFYCRSSSFSLCLGNICLKTLLCLRSTLRSCCGACTGCLSRITCASLNTCWTEILTPTICIICLAIHRSLKHFCHYLLFYLTRALWQKA